MFILCPIAFFISVGVFILQLIDNIFYEGSSNISETAIIVLLIAIMMLLFTILQKLDAKDIGKE